MIICVTKKIQQILHLKHLKEPFTIKVIAEDGVGCISNCCSFHLQTVQEVMGRILEKPLVQQHQ